MKHEIEALPFPVTRTGTYFNQATGRYEFWFKLNDGKAKLGECKRDLPAEVIKAWRAETMAGLQGRVFKAIAEGTLKVDPKVALGTARS